jgi:hypothetical protein
VAERRHMVIDRKADDYLRRWFNLEPRRQSPRSTRRGASPIQRYTASRHGVARISSSTPTSHHHVGLTVVAASGLPARDCPGLGVRRVQGRRRKHRPQCPSGAPLEPETPSL